MTKIKIEPTERGFANGKFIDRYGLKCSIQQSSLATEDAIWLGVDDPEPKIMASKAHEYGIETNETTGWITFPIPKDVLLHTRMHLTKKQVKALLPLLTKFVETGEID